jgi:hypothetical protein
MAKHIFVWEKINTNMMFIVGLGMEHVEGGED